MNSNKRKQKFNKPRSGDRLISVNRRARYEYHILKSMEAGITLKGTEIKSIRTARVSIQHSFARISKSEAWLHGMHIPAYEKGNIYNHDPARPRKLLLRKAQIKDGDRVIGNRTRVKIVKNKVAPPFRGAQFDIMYGEGISKTGEIIDMGVDHNIIEKSGSWFSYNGTKLGQGRESVRQILKDNPELSNELEKKITELYS